MKTSGIIIATLDPSMRHVRNPRRNSVRDAENDNGTFLPLSLPILRHLIHATSVTCRQNTTFARHGPPGALKNPRGDSFRICERHPTRAEFQCTCARTRVLDPRFVYVGFTLYLLCARRICTFDERAAASSFNDNYAPKITGCLL